eukprot:scaffold7832_cov103-Cylindrotheca_fusiformis.AAC.2
MPTITHIDQNSPEEDHGAPDWIEAFESGDLQRLVPVDEHKTHGVLSSIAWQTREGGLLSKNELASHVRPVMLSPDSQFGELASALPVADGQSEPPPVFKVFFFPSYVLLQWDSFGRRLRPVMSFAVRFKAIIFFRLLWIVVKIRWSQNGLHVSILTLQNFSYIWLTHCHSPSQPNGIGLNDRDEVVTFQYQFDRFLWAFHCDRIQRFPSTWSTWDDKLAFYWFPKHGDQLYPEGLGDSKAPPTHRPFFGFLFRPSPTGWPHPSRDLSQGFDALDKKTQVPDELH